MKRFLVTCTAIVMVAMTPAVSHSTEWMAAAVNNHGWGFSGPNYYDEEDARSGAMDACENVTGWTCNHISASVPTGWYLVLVSCPNGLSVGGSRHDEYTAQQNASGKKGYSNCRIVRSW